MICLFSYKRINSNDYVFPNDTNVFKYKAIHKSYINYLSYVSNYIKESDDDVYIVSVNAYALKLESNMIINKYDLVNNGNMGRDGEEKLIKGLEDNCKNRNCIFLVDMNNVLDSDYNQCSQKIIRYIIDNYNNYGMLNKYPFYVYKNY